MFLDISDNLENIILDSPIEGRCQFFSMIMKELSRLNGTLRLNYDLKTNLGEYTHNIITLKDALFKNNKIRFKNEIDFIIFVHEACHFLHFSLDNGLFISPILELYGKKISYEEALKNRRSVEFEAAWRSNLMDETYHLWDNPRLNLEMNLKNLFVYDIEKQSKEIQEKYEKGIKRSIKGVKGKINQKHAKNKFLNSIIGKVKNLEEWVDPQHAIIF